MTIVTPFQWTSSREYRAVLTADAKVYLGMGYSGRHEFCSEDGTLRGVLENDMLTLRAGYASDLCSPGYYLFGKWFGTPSKGAEIPAFLHDFARQFMRPNVACSPWDRKGSDVIFYNALTMVKHPLRDIYHGAVAGVFGNAWMALNRPRPKNYCRCCTSTALMGVEDWAEQQPATP